MKICLLVLAFVSYAAASDVLDFTEDFAIGNYPVILVEFFAPWCGHCKKLAPEYEKAATILKSNDPPVPIAKVDCTANAEVCKDYDVSGYPTLKIFRNGAFAEDYNGGRDAGGIVKTMKSKAGPPSKLCETVKDMEKTLNGEVTKIVGFFAKSDSDIAKVFDTVAAGLPDFSFAHTTSKDVLKKYKREDEIVIFRGKNFQSKFEDNEVVYDGDVKEHKLKDWVKETCTGLCGQRTADSMDLFKKRPLFTAYYDVDYVKNPKGTNYWRNRVMKVAKKLKDDGVTAYFSVSNSNEMQHELSEFGAETGGDKPVICALDSRERKFKMEDEFSMDALEKFVKDVVGDKLEPYMKSEPVPEPNDEPVKVVVAKNFDEIVNNKDKDVLIEFYAPWCGHCKSLAPKWDELAEKLKDEPEITIAKMDATANDVAKPFEVRGFPTLFFVPKDSKDSPKKYEGGREVDDFIKYLAKEATNPLQGYDRKGKVAKGKKKNIEL